MRTSNIEIRLSTWYLVAVARGWRVSASDEFLVGPCLLSIVTSELPLALVGVRIEGWRLFKWWWCWWLWWWLWWMGSGVVFLVYGMAFFVLNITVVWWWTALVYWHWPEWNTVKENSAPDFQQQLIMWKKKCTWFAPGSWELESAKDGVEGGTTWPLLEKLLKVPMKEKLRV